MPNTNNIEEKVAEFLELKNSGKTYREIAEMYGCSKQNVYTLLAKHCAGKVKSQMYFDSSKITTYPVIADFFETNQITSKEFLAIFGLPYHTQTLERFIDKINNKKLTILDAEKLADYMNMSLSEVFNY